MVDILGQNLGFWFSTISGILILLHIPGCNLHWSNQIKGLSVFMHQWFKKHHNLTLNLAVFFAFAHLILTIIGLFTGLWL